MSTPSELTVFRGELWHVLSAAEAAEDRLEAIPSGALVIGPDGRIVAAGPWSDLQPRFPDARVIDCGERLILPGFIDIHLHFPQLDIIGCYGEQLIGWLNRYTFPTECGFASEATARATAERLVTELFANGTTMGVIFGSTHAVAADALFAECDRRGARAIIGKVSMDRNAPEGILQDAASDARDSEHLIRTWHRRNPRLTYALTPRFAPTCSGTLLESMAELNARHDGLYIQTHYAENMMEIKWVGELYPQDRDYLGVYERFGLLGPRTLLAHAIHIGEGELRRIAETGAVIAHCPTSNLFLGSGLFPMREARALGVRHALGTDIGGGTSLSMWTTMAEAYKIQQLRGHSVNPARLLALATTASAEALGMQHELGNFAPGKWADFQILNPRRHRLLAPRFQRPATPLEHLFALITLADDRIVEKVYVQGKEVFDIESLPPQV